MATTQTLSEDRIPRTAEFLRSIDTFKSLDLDAAIQLVRRCEYRIYEPGEAIVRRGDTGDCMYVIEQGWVRVPVLDDNDHQIMVAQLREKQCFGETALFTGDPRNADVVAGDACRCLVIPRAAFMDLLTEHRQVAMCLTEILGERLMSVNGIKRVGKYKLIGLLGRGGVAVVYEGVHPTLNRPVAIKMLSHSHVYHPHFADRFRNEAKIIANLRHPHIVEIFDTEEAYATFFIVMEKLAGRDLEKILDEGKLFGFDEVRNIVCQVAAALEYAHSEGVVHRDVKPSNIVLDSRGEVKLTDFGIALVPDLEKELAMQERLALGSPMYMAPEQAMAKPVDGRADIYALGVVAYELLTGLPPYDHEDPREVLRMHVNKPMPTPREKNPSVPADLEAFVAKATQKKPAKRFQSGAEILEFFGRNNKRMADLGVKTLTFVFEPDRVREVDRLIDEIQHWAARYSGIIVR